MGAFLIREVFSMKEEVWWKGGNYLNKSGTFY
jgi:hypothetical protein